MNRATDDMVGLTEVQAEDKLLTEKEMLPAEAASVEPPEPIRPEEYVEMDSVS